MCLRVIFHCCIYQADPGGLVSIFHFLWPDHSLRTPPNQLSDLSSPVISPVEAELCTWLLSDLFESWLLVKPAQWYQKFEIEWLANPAPPLPPIHCCSVIVFPSDLWDTLARLTQALVPLGTKGDLIPQALVPKLGSPMLRNRNWFPTVAKPRCFHLHLFTQSFLETAPAVLQMLFCFKLSFWVT